MKLAVKPLLRLGLTFAIVWFYHGLTTGFLAGVPQLIVVVALAVPTWVVLGRVLFGADGDPGPFAWDWRED